MKIMPQVKSKYFHVLFIYSFNKCLRFYYVSSPVLSVKDAVVKTMSKVPYSRGHVLVGDMKHVKYKKR